jgi:hypothetical protein
MRFTTYGLVAVLAVLATCRPAEAFGRGAARAGVAVGPRGGVAAGASRGGVATGPFGGVHAGGAQHGTYVGPRGTTVQAGRAGGASVGPLGGVHAGGASGVKVTTPGGRTYTDVNAGRASVGPAGGVRVAGGSASSVRGPYGGGAAVGYRGGVAVGPAGGVMAGASRGGVAVGPYGGVAAGSRVGVVGHTTTYMSPNTMRAAAHVARSGYAYSVFTPNWYRTHTVAWTATRWVGPGIWVPPVWPAVATFVGVSAPPILYDYGSTVVIQNDTVYVNGESVGSAADYSAQATTIADTGRQVQPPADDQWQPLGVFGMIQPEDKVAQRIFQLAVNKSGVIRGNYYDSVADTTTPVYGSVDPKSQRAAWSIGDKKDIIFEAGLNNLTQNESTLLIHYGKERTQQMMLVRLEEPKDGK